MASKDTGDVSVASAVDNNCISTASATVPDNYARIKNKLLEGLSPLEVDIYLLLLQSGPKKTVDMAECISTDRRTAFHLLSALQDKGLAMATFKHPIQFTAVPIDKALEILSKNKTKYYARIR